MKKKIILRASQFISELDKTFGIKVQVSDVHLRRLSFLHRKKDNGFVCFYAVTEESVYYLKAFCGKTRRQVRKVKRSAVSFPTIEYLAPCQFIVGGENCAYRQHEGDLVLYPDFDVSTMYRRS